MPIARFQMPDGRIARFEVPEGTSPEEAQRLMEVAAGGMPAPKTAPFSAGDVAKSFGQGVLGAGKALTDVFGADNSTSQFLDAGSQALQASKTQATRDEALRHQQRMQAAERTGSVKEEAKAAIQNFMEAPLQTTAQGMGSIAPFLIPVAGQKALALRIGAPLAATAVKAAQTVIGAGMGAGAVKGAIYDAVYAQALKDGDSPVEAERKAAEAQTYAKNPGQIAAGTGLGAVAGRYGVENLLTRGGAKNLAPGMARRVGTAVATEMGPEMVQGGQERLAANLALQREGYDTPTWQGVTGQAVQEGLTAGVAAAPVAAARSPKAHLAEQELQKRMQDAQAQRTQQEQTAAAQQAKLQDPAYAAQVAQEYQAAEAQFAQLKAAAKVGKDASMADKLQAEQAQAQVKTFETEVLRPKAEAYLQVKPLLDAQQVQAPAAAPAAPQGNTDLFGEPLQDSSAQAPARIPTPEDITAQHSQYQRQIAGLEGALEQQRHNVAVAAQTGETDIAAQEAQKFRKIEAALEQARKEAKELPPAPKAGPTDDALNKQYATAQTALRKAGEIGDVDAIERLSKKIDALRQENPGLFTKDSMQATAAVDQQVDAERTARRGAVAQARGRIEQTDVGVTERLAAQRDREVEGMERAALPYGTTAQRTLFTEDQPEGVRPAEQTKQSQLQALALQLQAARREYKADPNNTQARKQVDSLLEQMRAIKSKPGMDEDKPAPKGKLTAPVATDLAGTRLPETLPTAQKASDTERTLVPGQATEKSIRAQIAQAKQTGRAPIILAPVEESLGALSNAKALGDVAELLHRNRIGQDYSEVETRIKEKLSTLEQGKRSDEVSQGDMFPDTELQGVIFDTPEEFQKFLASDALNESRKAVGLALQTSARAYKTLAPLEAKAAELRESIGTLQTMLAATKRVGAERVEAAMAAHDKAVERIKAQEKALDVQLQPLQAAYIKAQLALSKAADTLAGVLNSIAKNTAKFNSDIDLQTLAAETAQAQDAHAAMLRRAANGGKVSSEESAKLYNASVAAINAHRSGLEQYLKTGNKLQERSILAFLNRDMDFMLRLRDAEQSMERANEGLNNARDQLDAADKEIRNSADYLAEQRINKRNEANARGVLTKARGMAVRNTERVSTEIQARDDERAALDTEIRNTLAEVERAQATRTAVPLGETQAQREAQDARNRIAEQERLERRQAIPGMAVSFEQARKTTEYIAKLQDRAKFLEERSKDETATKSMRNKDKYAAANTRKEIAIAFGTLSNETETSTAAKQALTEYLAELDTKIGEKKAATLEPGIAKKTILERRKDLTDLRSKKRELVRLQEQAQQRAKKTEILTPEQRAQEAQDDANRLTLERGIDASTGKSSGALPLRKAGPLVKPVLGGKVTQGGRVPKMRANEQALAELSKIETLLEKAQFKLEEAQENNDTEAIEKYTGFVARLEKARPVAEQALEKSSRTARAVTDDSAPSKADRAFRTSTDMTPELAAAVADGRILDAADMLIKAGYPLAASVRPLVLRTKISVDPNIRDNKGREVAGMYFPETNEIVMRPDAYMEDVMHELYHAATDSVLLADPATLTPEQAAARKGLEGMQRQVSASKAFANEEIPNVREFVAEARTNPEFQAKLNRYSLWDKIKNFVKLMLFKPRDPVLPTAQQVAALVDKIMMPSRRMQGAGTPSVQRTAGSAKDVIDRIVAKDKSWWDKVRANLTGLALEVQLVDRHAALERLSRVMEPLRGYQMMHYLRMYDQRSHLLAVSAGNGVVQRVEKTRADGRKEYILESVGGANLKHMATTLAKAPIEDKNYVSRLFTGYMAAIRAKSKGIATLNFGGSVTQADLDAIAQEVQNTPGLKDVFEDARRQYNEYNRNLIKLLEQSGRIDSELAQRLVKEDDYIPYYREEGGVAQLLIGSESPIRIGNMKAQPHLQELVGGDRPILDWTTSAIQNTSMILDMALNNIATKNAAFELQDMGMATIGNGHDVKGNTIVHFFDKGAEKFARVDTPDSIPADLLVKGMAGIPTQLSGVVRLLAMPAQLLRKAVTISPVYHARMVFRDSLSAALGSGANIIPVYSAVKEINSKNKDILNNRGITGGQMFSGNTSEDMSMVLREITAGKPGWMNLVGKLEMMGREADALTRRAQYDSYLKQGLSEMEASTMALESMNFSKRGASPSIHMANAMIPFLNAQIQSLNVLYKSFTGNMPHNERLNIKGKLIARGALLAAASLAYAAAMEDDEAYKNALPEQKYGNWIVRVPGLEEPLRVPVPFELGYIFKAVPEALYRSMTDKHGSDEAVKAFSSILRNTVPGGSSYGLPQAIKPLLEVGTGKSLFTGRDILSRSEQGMEKPFQFRETTTQLAREAGQLTGQSPIMMEQLLNGYTGGVGMFVLAAVDSLMPRTDSPEKAARRLSSRPMIGGIFQPNDAGGIINDTSEKMGEFTAFKKTVDGLLEKGERAQAMQLLQERSKEYAAADVAGAFTQKMGQLSKAETAIRASDRSPEEKSRMLDNIRQYKIQTAEQYREVYGKVKGE